jgi:pyruvate,water dikinase
MPAIDLKIMMNVGNPQLAFDFCQLPNAGVGLARLEFIINNNIGVHPKAILDYPHVAPDLKNAVESVARGHASPRAFYVDKVAEGVATIAAAFWPKPVIVRLSDFKSNEYRKLIGGSRYEPEEENPMLGFRGAARYVSADFREAFAMECEAIKRVRNTMGLENVQVMVPFVRTLEQARRAVVLQLADETDFQQYLVDNGYTADAQIVLLAELRDDVAVADAARVREEGLATEGLQLGDAVRRARPHHLLLDGRG